LRVFENGALRKVFGPKGEEITTGWRKLQTDERHALYSSPNILRVIKPRRMRWAGNVAWTCIQCFDGQTRTKETLGKPRGKENNIKMDIKQDDVVWCCVL